ncbi:MAG: iron-sulfur cluster assembly scaffold protein [Patescibacteria group bacterium]|nr:iron-sulfur cluster assembly scaffold protein [Patescibacteria group bacterium]
MPKNSLYKEVIIDHFKNPRNWGRLKKPDLEAHVTNSVCGDEVTVQMNLKNGKVHDIKFEGKGCAICVAGSSIISEKIKGMSVESVNDLDHDVVLDLMGMNSKSPRLKCAVLGLEAAKRAVADEDDDPCDFC